MADTRIFFSMGPDGLVPIRAKDLGDGEFAIKVDADIATLDAIAPAFDTTNELVKTGRLLVGGTTRTASNWTLLGVGTLVRVIASNAHATDPTTIVVTDSDAGGGSRLGPDLVIPARTTQQFDIELPYSIGVHFAFTGGTPSAMGYGQGIL